MKFINNPFEILMEVIKENYPSVSCDIIIGEQLTDGINTFGCTLFPDDEKESIKVEIHPSLSLIDATETLAHELAHVIVGKSKDHNEEWEHTFSFIHSVFEDKINQKFMEEI